MYFQISKLWVIGVLKWMLSLLSSSCIYLKAQYKWTYHRYSENNFYLIHDLLPTNIIWNTCKYALQYSKNYIHRHTRTHTNKTNCILDLSSYKQQTLGTHVPMTFDLLVDPPEKYHMVYPCVMTRNHLKNIHEDGILMLLVPGNLDLIAWMGHQNPSEGEKILIRGSGKI